MILKKNIIEQLSKELSLPFTGIEQDWDLEMADSKRINAFLEFYKKKDLSSDEKLAVMSLILASYEDFINENDSEIDHRWNEIKIILESDKKNFLDLIDYWSLFSKTEEDCLFQLTPHMRNIKY